MRDIATDNGLYLNYMDEYIHWQIERGNFESAKNRYKNLVHQFGVDNPRLKSMANTINRAII